MAACCDLDDAGDTVDRRAISHGLSGVTRPSFAHRYLPGGCSGVALTVAVSGGIR